MQSVADAHLDLYYTACAVGLPQPGFTGSEVLTDFLKFPVRSMQSSPVYALLASQTFIIVHWLPYFIIDSHSFRVFFRFVHSRI